MRLLRSSLVTALFGLMVLTVQSSEGFDELAQRAKAGATEDALLAFAQQTNIAYNLTVDEIFALSDLGYTPKTIASIVNFGKAANDANAEKVANQPQIAALPVEVPAPNLNPVPQEQRPIPNAAAQPPPFPLSRVANLAPTPGANGALQTITTTNGETLQIEDSIDLPITTADVIAPPEGEASVGMFFDTLAPYGSWVRASSSWYWRPTACITDPNWRPYCDRGHWTWTDSDWCWQSDYSWGWAPFHYGRWSNCPGYGWLWLPDTLWSPAWVSWRGCESHYGWAPLPWSARYDPGFGFHHGGKHYGADFGFGLNYHDFCFVPRDHFCDVTLRLNIIHRRENEHFFHDSHGLGNTVASEGHRVIIAGPQFDHVQSATKEQIKQLHISDAPVKPGEHIVRTSREDRNAGTLHLYRPAVNDSAPLTTASVAAKKSTLINAALTHNAPENRVPHTGDRVNFNTSTPQTQAQNAGNNSSMKNSIVTHDNSGSTQSPSSQRNNYISTHERTAQIPSHVLEAPAKHAPEHSNSSGDTSTKRTYEPTRSIMPPPSAPSSTSSSNPSSGASSSNTNHSSNSGNSASTYNPPSNNNSSTNSSGATNNNNSNNGSSRFGR